MRCISSPSHDPYLNIAAEEYALKNLQGDCFILYRNDKSVIIGAHQNTLAEINQDFIRERHIKVVRRLSGGGAVFHDLGNLNFTFIVEGKAGEMMNFRKFTEPILEVLLQMGIEARFEGRNDLTIKGMKFSGNAEHIHRNRVLHHGTLLFSSLITDLSGALSANPLKFVDKAVKSVRSRVTNISEHLGEPMTVEAFQDRVMQHMAHRYPDSYQYNYSATDLAAIQTLAAQKYSTWEWNFGTSPKYNFTKGVRAQGGHVECHLNVEKGIITYAKIFGDFFSHKDTGDFEQALIGLRHKKEVLEAFLNTFDLPPYFTNITAQELMEALI